MGEEERLTYIRKKRAKRRIRKREWMAKQIKLELPKDPEWFLKFNMEHLGWRLFFKQFRLNEEEINFLVYSVLKDD